MYEDLVRALRAADARPCSDLECPGSGECPTVGCLFREAADAIEELQKDLERSKEYEVFWEKEANEALKKFQVAVASKPRWIPVTERLPEKNTWVLAYCKYKGHVVDYMDINGLWSYGNITHWMPLPEPPKEDT